MDPVCRPSSVYEVGMGPSRISSVPVMALRAQQTQPGERKRRELQAALSANTGLR